MFVLHKNFVRRKTIDYHLQDVEAARTKPKQTTSLCRYTEYEELYYSPELAKTEKHCPLFQVIAALCKECFIYYYFCCRAVMLELKQGEKKLLL